MVFHDRRLQYTEHQQLEGWRWNRPGDRILDLGQYYDHKFVMYRFILHMTINISGTFDNKGFWC